MDSPLPAIGASEGTWTVWAALSLLLWHNERPSSSEWMIHGFGLVTPSLFRGDQSLVTADQTNRYATASPFSRVVGILIQISAPVLGNVIAVDVNMNLIKIVDQRTRIVLFYLDTERILGIKISLEYGTILRWELGIQILGQIDDRSRCRQKERYLVAVAAGRK